MTDKHSPAPAISDYPYVRTDVIRSRDLDFQKHVNNTVFMEFCAASRFDFNADIIRPHLAADAKLFVARFEIDFLGELRYGAPVQSGLRVASVGRTSLRLEHALFQNERCAARAISVMVHTGEGGSRPWPENLRAALAAGTAS